LCFDVWAHDLDEAYLEHLTAADLAVLLDGVPRGDGRRASPDASDGRPDQRPDHAANLRRRAREAGVERLLARRELAECVLAPGEVVLRAGAGGAAGAGGRLEAASVAEPGRLAAVSPFFVFAVAVQASAAGLSQASYVNEWVGPGRRAPVFDVPHLAEFLADSRRRLFLAELLASYTKVASGSMLVATRRGLRRQRWSELDPVRLAGMLEAVAPAERPGVLRRLGDLALFLTGVFPDYVARRGFGPIEEGRLLRAGTTGNDHQRGGGSSGAQTPSGGSAATLAGDGGAVGLLDQLGRRWYAAAYELLPRPVPAGMAVIGDLPARFGEARRILNHLTEHHLFARRERFFGRGA
jgi:hypothetical protein